MISQTVEYALRAAVTIAQHEGRPCTAQQISQLAQIPAPYLSKIMQRLVRGKVVNSQRGLHGGFVLARPPNELTVWDIVNAVEPLQRLHTCPLGIQSHSNTLCALHRCLDAAMATVEEQFRSTAISDIISEANRVAPLCQSSTLTDTTSTKRPQQNST